MFSMKSIYGFVMLQEPREIHLLISPSTSLYFTKLTFPLFF